MKFAKVAQTLKLISDIKEKKLRKLELTDQTTDFDCGSSANETSGDSGFSYDTSVSTTAPIEEYESTPATESESGNANAANVLVEASKPVATTTKITRNTRSSVQITKFHSFSRPTTRGPGKVTFGTFFYFLGRQVVKFIIVRLRITYSRGLKNLQEESARTDCSIKDPSLMGSTLSLEEGANVDYICEAVASAGDASIANFTLNTDVPMTMVNSNGIVESLDFLEVNFNGDTAGSSTSLQNNTLVINSAYYLKNTKVSINKYILIFTGSFRVHRRRLRNLEFRDRDIIKMNLLDNSNDIKKYNCTINGTNLTETHLSCDTSSNPIKTTVANLHLSSGDSTRETLFIEMNGFNNNGSYLMETGNSYIKATAEIYNTTNSNQAEAGNATAQDATVNSDKPVSSKGQVTDKKGSEVQAMKFHSFNDQRTQRGIISFGSFFYFIGKRVPYSVILSLRINYSSRIRDLQVGTADSLRSDCIIANEDLYGTTNSDGISVNYYCTANPTRNDRISKVQLNIDFNLVLAEKNGTVETLNFNSVSFDGIASEEATDIQTKIGTFSGVIAIISNAIATIDNYYLIISGTLEES